MSVSSYDMVQTSIESSLALKNSTKPTTADPQVEDHVQEVIDFAEDPHGDPGHVLSEIAADPSLTQAQKDDAIATVWELANGQTTPYGSVTEHGQQELLQAFDDIGHAWSGDYTAEFRAEMTESIGRSVDSGRLSEDEVYGVLTQGGTQPPSLEVRALLSEVDNAPLLDNVAARLIDDAKAVGYEGVSGAAYLAGAANLANMAAEHGWIGSSRAVLDEIGVAEANGHNVIEQILLDVPPADYANLDQYSGLASLSELIHSVGYVSGDRQVTTDRIFATLSRTASDSTYGGLGHYQDDGAVIDNLGDYFTENVDRLAELDWENANTTGSAKNESFYNGLLTDVTEGIVLNDDFAGREAFAEAIANTVYDLAATASDPNSSDAEIRRAGNTLGTIAGSLNQAAENYINQAGGNATALRSFTDLFTNQLISIGAKQAGPGGFLASAAAKEVVGAIWESVENGARSRAGGEVEDAIGDLRGTLADIRDAIGELDDSTLADRYDDREDQYHDND